MSENETKFIPPSFTKKFNGKVPVIKSNLPSPRVIEYARFKNKDMVDLDVALVEPGTVFHNVLVTAMPFSEGVVTMARITFDNNIQILTEASNLENTNFKNYQKFLKRQDDKMKKIFAFFEEHPNSYVLARALHPFSGEDEESKETSKIGIGEMIAIIKVGDKLQAHDMKNTKKLTFNVTAQDFEVVSFNSEQFNF